MTVSPDWIAVDWGTSRLRVWAMSDTGEVLAEAGSNDGMSRLDRAGFEPALLALVEPWLDSAGVMQVIASGMVGAREGWVEAPYARVPCAPLAAEGFVRPACRDPRLAVHVVPGLCQEAPADVMRGEETQIAGFLASEPGFSGVICLPGTHAKWVRVENGQVSGFHSFMTGELYALFRQHSLLRHAMGEEAWEEAAFSAGLQAVMAAPDKLAAQFFPLRAETLLHGLSPGGVQARLSGLLIGAELAALEKDWRQAARVIIGAGPQARLYARALQTVGVAAKVVSGEDMVLAGLAAARSRLQTYLGTATGKQA